MRSGILLPLAALATVVVAQLETLAKAKGFVYFGTATDNPELTDAPYVSLLSNISDFGQITPGNSQKWDTTEPSQNVFSYTKGDVVADLAKKNGQLLRCHTFVWYNQLPSWVTSGTWTNATLTAVLQNHITNVATHYKGRCYAWDVVNEAFNEDGTYRPNIFYNTIGSEYISIAFMAAAAADPDTKLYYNDYNIEYAGAKSTAAQNLVKSLKARGIKIDGVGLQAHFIAGSTPSTSAQTTNMQAFIDLGVQVAVTELDVRIKLPVTDALLAQQSKDYVSTVDACLAVGRSCVGVTVWDFYDKYSWVPSTFSGQGAACLFDDNLVKKPAYYGIVAALGGNSSGATASTVSATTFSTIASSSVASATPTGTSTAGTVTKYGQCGGTGYSGSTICVSGSTCNVVNQWYSQCL